MTLTSMKGLGSKRKKKKTRKRQSNFILGQNNFYLIFINGAYLNLFFGFCFLPESKAIDFGGATGWNITGNIAPGNWLSIWKKRKKVENKFSRIKIT